MAAPTIDELVIADDGALWSALGFDVHDGVCQIGAVTLRFLADERQRGIVAWSLRDLANTALDGLESARSERPARSPAPAQENGVVSIDHVVAMSPELDRTVAALCAAGLDLRRVRDEPTPAGAPRQAFFRLGAEILEVIQEPQEAIARGGGPDHPTRFWGLALNVADLDRTVEWLGERCSPPRVAVQPGRRIATLRRAVGLAVPVALMTPPIAA
jgi:hypothetical protein